MIKVEIGLQKKVLRYLLIVTVAIVVIPLGILIILIENIRARILFVLIMIYGIFYIMRTMRKIIPSYLRHTIIINGNKVEVDGKTFFLSDIEKIDRFYTKIKIKRKYLYEEVKIISRSIVYLKDGTVLTFEGLDLKFLEYIGKGKPVVYRGEAISPTSLVFPIARLIFPRQNILEVMPEKIRVGKMEYPLLDFCFVFLREIRKTYGKIVLVRRDGKILVIHAKEPLEAWNAIANNLGRLIKP